MFKPGQTGNPKGRPKGESLVIARTREIIRKGCANSIKGIKADLEHLTPADRLACLAKLLPYIVPRMEEVEHSGNVSTGPIFQITVSAETAANLKTAISNVNKK